MDADLALDGALCPSVAYRWPAEPKGCPVSVDPPGGSTPSAATVRLAALMTLERVESLWMSAVHADDRFARDLQRIAELCSATVEAARQLLDEDDVAEFDRKLERQFDEALAKGWAGY